MLAPCAFKKTILALFLCVAGLGVTVRAQVIIFDNLSLTNSGNRTINGLTSPTGQEFLTDSTNLYIQSITLRGTPATSATTRIRIFTTSASHPGTDFGLTFTLSSVNSVGIPTFTFSPITGASLSANTLYWVVLDTSSVSDTASWQYTASNAGTGSGYQNNYADSHDSGASWTVGAASPSQMRVTMSTTAIPEPAATSAALATTAILAMIAARRGRRKIVSVRPQES